MWKLLIADDEPKIRRGLRSLIGRCGDDLEIVAEAEDGEMAFEKAIELKPDIMLIDVRMPICGGLELIERLNAALPGNIIIIVSGHDEFEYAQAAVKLRVFDYVLKPVDAQNFATVLSRARAELSARREASKYTAWAHEQFGRNLPVLRERFLGDWVTGALSRTELEEGLSFLQIKLASPATLIAARFAEGLNPSFPGTDKGMSLSRVAMRAVISDALPEDGSYVFEDTTETILGLAPGFPQNELIARIDGIERRAANQVGHVPAIVYRTVPWPLDGLVDAYDELRVDLADGEGCEAFVVLARNYIEKYYWNPDLSLEDAAIELQISPAYISRLMKRETGFSFIEYLNRVRIKKATILMSDPSAKAFEVAERVGYRSQNYFSRAFKKVTGSSPTERRKGGQS
jgi:two-component system response regulator YesN